MNKPKVVITHWVHDEAIALLERSCSVAANHTRESLSGEELLKRCRDADALMVFMPDRVDDAFLSRCPDLKVIAAALKGYDNFDVAACTGRGVWFTIVPDLLTEATAEMALALMLGLVRNMAPGDRLVRGGGFRGWRPVLYGGSLRGNTVGIVGMGAVGQAVAARLKGFGCRICYHDPRPLDGGSEAVLDAAGCSFPELLEASDIVLTAVPLTRRTLHLFDKTAIGAMKRGAFLVNIGRGSVVDESAVAGALAANHLAGYGADVFEFEDWQRPDRPLTVHPALLASDRTLFSPHLGSAVDAVRRDIALEAAREIMTVLEGGTPMHAVNHLRRCL
jgi:phosphonate dehydrogenase